MLHALDILYPQLLSFVCPKACTVGKVVVDESMRTTTYCCDVLSYLNSVRFGHSLGVELAASTIVASLETFSQEYGSGGTTLLLCVGMTLAKRLLALDENQVRRGNGVTGDVHELLDLMLPLVEHVVSFAAAVVPRIPIQNVVSNCEAALPQSSSPVGALLNARCDDGGSYCELGTRLAVSAVEALYGNHLDRMSEACRGSFSTQDLDVVEQLLVGTDKCCVVGGVAIPVGSSSASTPQAKWPSDLQRLLQRPTCAILLQDWGGGLHVCA